MTGLIYDLGLHKGEDTEFYLKKGFRVVAVDANPEMCGLAAERLREHVEEGRLTILNVAIADQRGTIPFYRNEVSEWGTVDPEWAARNQRLGRSSEQLLVEAVPLGDILQEHGEPHYLKIDIEGMDHAALEALARSQARPKYVSIESEKVSFRRLRHEFELFAKMGYDRFKVVQQRDVPKQVPPCPALEGTYAEHTFRHGSSGLFGEEAPGEWLTAEQALRLYKRIFWHYRLYGDDPVIGGRLTRKIVWGLGFRPGWYDTHARHSGA